jgi:superfamily II DNA or RNA helicase
VIITVGNVWASITQHTEDELAFVRGYLSYRSVNHRGKAKQSSLLVKTYFPAGLARRLVKVARESGFSVEVVLPTRKVEIAEGYGVEGIAWEARQHQREALDAIRKHRRGLVQHATGAGKSDLIGLLASLIKGKVLIVSTSRKLNEDLRERVSKFRAPIERGAAAISRGAVVVCNDDSLKNLSDAEMASFDAVLCDEAHHVASATHQTAHNPLRRLGNRSKLIASSI